MDRSAIVQDLNDVVNRALAEQLHLRPEIDLLRQSDAVLRGLPTMRGEVINTTRLLRRYHVQLQHELCEGGRPRISPQSVDEELHELTRAVLVTMGGSEGLPVYGAALIALVLYKRGLATFCAMPSTEHIAA